MRKRWSKRTVYSLCGLFMIGVLICLPKSGCQIEAHAQTNSMNSGESTVSDQSLQAMSKAASTGWEEDQDGWKYKNTDGTYVTGGFSASKGYWYYFDQDGYMVKGWQKVCDDWYYFNQEGHMVTGDITISEKHYSFEATGKLKKQYYNAD